MITISKVFCFVLPAPSRMAFATSEASARVQRGFLTMDSSIWVAQMMGLPALLHFEIICFCAMKTLKRRDNKTSKFPAKKFFENLSFDKR